MRTDGAIEGVLGHDRGVTMRHAFRGVFLSGLIGATLILALSSRAVFAAPVISREVFHQPSSSRVGEPVLIFGEGLASPVRVFFKSASATVEATPVVTDLVRGVILVNVPAGAVTGNMHIKASGVDSADYFFRVTPGSFTQGTDVVSGRVVDPNGAGVGNTAVILFGNSGCDEGNNLQDFAQADPNG